VEITYEAEWNEVGGSPAWGWDKFIQLLNRDGLEGLPAAARLSIPGHLTCKVEDFSIRVTLHERTPEGVFVNTPEDDGIPCFLLYGPRATIKMRCESMAMANQSLTMLHNREPTQVQH
jgi:hypothetical protein